MRFVTFRRADGRTQPGVVEGDAIRPISTPTLLDYIALAPHERIAWHAADESVPLDEVEACARVLAAWVVRELEPAG